MTPSGTAICVLGSGSAGNCTALRRRDGGVTLVDAGLSPRMTRRRLAEIGLEWAAVTDILLTHTDRDHFHLGWPKALAHRADLSVHVSDRHAARLADDGSVPPGRRPLSRRRDGHVGAALCGAEAIGTTLPHDADGTIGWRIAVDGVTIGVATDLGRVPSTLLELFDGVDALLLESNYDPHMQLAAPRPPFLKARIMGGCGHLSNAEALDAACRIARRTRLRHLVLLHLSRQCNCPRLVRSLYEREAPHLAERLVIAEQSRPTRWLTVRDDGSDSLLAKAAATIVTERTSEREEPSLQTISTGTPPSEIAARCSLRHASESAGI